jgi:hypothetical protein
MGLAGNRPRRGQLAVWLACRGSYPERNPSTQISRRRRACFSGRGTDCVSITNSVAMSTESPKDRPLLGIAAPTGLTRGMRTAFAAMATTCADVWMSPDQDDIIGDKSAFQGPSAFQIFNIWHEWVGVGR